MSVNRLTRQKFNLAKSNKEYNYYIKYEDFLDDYDYKHTVPFKSWKERYKCKKQYIKNRKLKYIRYPMYIKLKNNK